MRSWPGLVETAFLVIVAATIAGGAGRWSCGERVVLAAVLLALMWATWPFLFVARL